MTSTWTVARLHHLFERYRDLYWPKSHRLRAFVVRAAQLDRTYGRCENEQRLILIDVARHSSDRELRATLLHEMIHAVVGRPGHGSPFWTQLEYLLARNAPITISFPELGEHGRHLCIVPPRFRRCRRMFAPIYRRYVRAMERECSTGRITEYDYTIGHMEIECEDAARDGATWVPLWARQARQYGFVDLDGRLLPVARKWRDAARRGYVRGRRFYLEETQREQRFRTAQAG